MMRAPSTSAMVGMTRWYPTPSRALYGYKLRYLTVGARPPGEVAQSFTPLRQSSGEAILTAPREWGMICVDPVHQQR